MINVFSGCTSVSVDDKSRMAIPKKNRDDLLVESGLVLTLHYSGECLLLYQKPEWDRIVDGLKNQPRETPFMQRMMRTLVGYAMECSLDKTNRLLLPQEHRVAACLDQTVMLVGQINKFEIWDSQRWDKTQAKLKESYEDDLQGNSELLMQVEI